MKAIRTPQECAWMEKLLNAHPFLVGTGQGCSRQGQQGQQEHEPPFTAPHCSTLRFIIRFTITKTEIFSTADWQ